MIRFEETPNPNAVKAILDRSPGAAPRAYRSADAAKDDPLGSALMAGAGVTNVLIHDGWVSVGKSPGAAWKDVKKFIKQVLADAE